MVAGRLGRRLETGSRELPFAGGVGRPPIAARTLCSPSGPLEARRKERKRRVIAQIFGWVVRALVILDQQECFWLARALGQEKNLCTAPT